MRSGRTAFWNDPLLSVRASMKRCSGAVCTRFCSTELKKHVLPCEGLRERQCATAAGARPSQSHQVVEPLAREASGARGGAVLGLTASVSSADLGGRRWRGLRALPLQRALHCSL
jgi:hypothetical protein